MVRHVAGRLRSQGPLSFLVIVACAVAAFMAGQAIAGAIAVGVSPDEYVHVLRFDHWLDTGWYVPTFMLSEGQSEASDPTSFLYGATFSVVAHLANVLLGNEPLGDISATADAYAVRHVLVSLLGLVAAWCVAFIVNALTRDRVAALWSSAALLAIPVWTGNAMFNVKDVPVATGYTLVTLGLVLGVLWTQPRTWLPARRFATIVAVTGAGFALAAGTRPAMWLPLLLSLAVLAGVAWIHWRSSNVMFSALVAPAVGYLAALVVIAALHPRLAATPITWLAESVSGSTDYPWTGVTLTAGEALSAKPPPWYLPAWVFAGVPLVVLGVAAGGLVSESRRIPRFFSRSMGAGPDALPTAGVLLVTVQLLLVPTAAILTGSTMYAGLRQHLYVLPAVAVLAGLGTAGLIRGWRTPGSRSSVRWALAALLALALVIPVVEQTRLFPYNYIYVNPVAGVGGVQDRWETELQFVSSREAFRRVPSAIEPECPLDLAATRAAGRDALSGSCDAFLSPFEAEHGTETAAGRKNGEVWVVGRQRNGADRPSYCWDAGSVTRSLRGEEIVMAHVLKCQLP